MTWSTSRVVMIARDREGTRAVLGAGAIVARERVLTARGIVGEAGGVFEELVVIHGERVSPVQRVLWAGDEALDVAVLEVALPDAPEAPGRFRDTALGLEKWHATGFVTLPDVIRREWGHKGETHPWEPGPKELTLHVEAERVEFGLPGAAVVVGEHIIGVIPSAPVDCGGRTVWATPAARFLREAGFREALGFHVVDPQVLRVQRELAQLLAGSELLTGALARRLVCASDALSATLVNEVSAKGLVEHVERAHDELPATAEGAHARQVAQAVLFAALPYVTDWRSLRTSCGAAGEGGDVIELPYRSDTIAEIVVAGLHNRSCRFELRQGGEPIGVAVVQLPATAQTALFQSERRLVEAIVRQLAEQLGVGAGALDDDERRLSVDVELERLRDRLRYYFLFRDAAVPGAESGERLWSLARATLRRDEGLPQLVLVRMSGRLNRDEAIIHNRIAAILRPRTP